MLMAPIVRRLLSPRIALVVSTALLAGLLAQISFTTADVTACPSPTSTDGFETTETETGDENHACGVVDNEGGSVQTEPPATPGNPHWTKVTIRPGEGEVTVDILETDEAQDVALVRGEGPPTPECSPSSSYVCLISQIETSKEPTERPMRFQFTYEEERFPFEPTKKRIQPIQMYHEETPVPPCEDGELEEGQLSCVLRKFVIDSSNERADEDVVFIVLTIDNGRWGIR
jgi:hypothetical protein